MSKTCEDFTDGVFPAKLVATSIKPVKELLEPNFTPEDVRSHSSFSCSWVPLLDHQHPEDCGQRGSFTSLIAFLFFSFLYRLYALSSFGGCLSALGPIFCSVDLWHGSRNHVLEAAV